MIGEKLGSLRLKDDYVNKTLPVRRPAMARVRQPPMSIAVVGRLTNNITTNTHDAI